MEKDQRLAQVRAHRESSVDDGLRARLDNDREAEELRIRRVTHPSISHVHFG
jgi:hypothetical protein